MNDSEVTDFGNLYAEGALFSHSFRAFQGSILK